MLKEVFQLSLEGSEGFICRRGEDQVLFRHRRAQGKGTKTGVGVLSVRNERKVYLAGPQECGMGSNFPVDFQ